MISHMTYADYMFGVYIFLAFLFGNFVYGLPVSLVSDWATAGAGKWRFDAGVRYTYGLRVRLLLFP